MSERPIRIPPELDVSLDDTVNVQTDLSQIQSDMYGFLARVDQGNNTTTKVFDEYLPAAEGKGKNAEPRERFKNRVPSASKFFVQNLTMLDNSIILQPYLSWYNTVPKVTDGSEGNASDKAFPTPNPSIPVIEGEVKDAAESKNIKASNATDPQLYIHRFVTAAVTGSIPTVPIELKTKFLKGAGWAIEFLYRPYSADVIASLKKEENDTLTQVLQPIAPTAAMLLTMNNHTAFGPTIKVAWGDMSVVVRTVPSPCAQIFQGDKPLGEPCLVTSQKHKWGDFESIIFGLYPCGTSLYLVASEPAEGALSEKELIKIPLENFAVTPEGTPTVTVQGHQWAFRVGYIQHPTAGLLVSPPIPNYYQTDPRTAFLNVWFRGKSTQDWVGEKTGGVMKENKLFPIMSGDNLTKDFAYLLDETQIFKGYTHYLTTTDPSDQTLQDQSKMFADITQLFEGVFKPLMGADLAHEYCDKMSEKVYEPFLKDSSIPRQYKYFLILTSKGSGLRTPMVVASDLVLRPNPKTISNLTQSGTIQIKKNDVLATTVSQSVEGCTATISLQNRVSESGGGYTGGRYNYTNGHRGIKPITIKARQDITGTSVVVAGSSEFETLFKGFITERTPHRDGGGGSQVEFQCEDVSLRMKSVRGFNMPIFDGYCHLAMIYWLATEAGFTDDEILFYQSPLDETDNITLAQVMAEVGNDNAAMRGPCWQGHVKGWPGASSSGSRFGVPSEFMHQLIPNAMFRENPYFMPQMGTELWNVASDMATRVSGWFLYANAFGNIVYQPDLAALNLKKRGLMPGHNAEAIETFTDFSFYEQAQSPGQYHEIQNSFAGHLSTKDSRNSVVIVGLTPIGKEEESAMVWPMVVVAREDGWPDNASSSVNWQPWVNSVFLQNSDFNDITLMKDNANFLLKRLQRPFFTARIGLWGQLKLKPYELVTVNEDGGKYGTNNNEVIGTKSYIVIGVTHEFQAGKLIYTSSAELELFDNNFRWAPPAYDYTYNEETSAAHGKPPVASVDLTEHKSEGGK